MRITHLRGRFDQVLLRVWWPPLAGRLAEERATGKGYQEPAGTRELAGDRSRCAASTVGGRSRRRSARVGERRHGPRVPEVSASMRRTKHAIAAIDDDGGVRTRLQPVADQFCCLGRTE